MLIYAHNFFQNTLDKYVMLDIYSQGHKHSAISAHTVGIKMKRTPDIVV